MADSAATPPQRGLLTESIARQLRRDILSGAFPAGSKLASERELALQCGASRNVIREVLRRLEAEHLILVEAGRGSYVNDLSTAEAHSYDALYRTSRPTVRQVMKARMTVELETAALAAQNATDAEFAAIRAAQEDMERAPDVVAKAQADVKFHDMIAAASGNPVLRVMLASISGMSFEIMLRSGSDPVVAKPRVPHHPEIIGAIAAGDPAEARRCMYEHLSLASRTYGADFDLPFDVMASRHIETLMRRPDTAV